MMAPLLADGVDEQQTTAADLERAGVSWLGDGGAGVADFDQHRAGFDGDDQFPAAAGVLEDVLDQFTDHQQGVIDPFRVWFGSGLQQGVLRGVPQGLRGCAVIKAQS